MSDRELHHGQRRQPEQGRAWWLVCLLGAGRSPSARFKSEMAVCVSSACLLLVLLVSLWERGSSVRCYLFAYLIVIIGVAVGCYWRHNRP